MRVNRYRFKKPPEREYGEFKCPYCPQIFFNKTSLSGHIGGKHRRFITQKTKKPYCKFCETELVKDKNWPKWAYTQKNLICKKCKRKQNRDSYHRKKRIKLEKKRKFQKHLDLIARNKAKRKVEKRRKKNDR
jgi:hypothetical protein